MANHIPIWCEGFEVFKTVAALSRRYISTSHNFTFGAGRLFAGRTGLYATTSFSSLKIPVQTAQRHWTIGCGVFFGLTTNNTKIIHTLSGNNDLVRLQVRDDGSGTAFVFELRTGSGSGTLLWTSPLNFPWGNELYIELRVDHRSDATGTIEFRVGEFLLANLTGIVTAPGVSSPGSAENVAFDLQINSGGIHRLDDIYVSADASTQQNFLGDQQIEGLFPTADFAAGWTRSTGAVNAALVDDATQSDDDSTYVFANADDIEDLYEFGDLVNIGGDVTCVAVYSDVRLVSSGSRNYKHSVRHSSTTATGALIVINDTAYRIKQTIFGTNPVTASAWAVADINAARFGQRTSA